MQKPLILVFGSIVLGMIIGATVIAHVGASPERRGGSPVGVWIATFPDAPFKYHMIVFNSDGTMQQANPDAGDAHTSDSDGMGIWVRDGDAVTGKFVEITADRETRAFATRGEISFEIKVTGDSFKGNAVGRFYDIEDKMVVGPVRTAFNGTRVTLP